MCNYSLHLISAEICFSIQFCFPLFVKILVILELFTLVYCLSLQSWASFDPPKTTVKRILKEDYGKGSADQSLSNADKPYLRSQVQNRTEVDHSALLNLSGASMSHIKTKGNFSWSIFWNF